MKNMRFLAIAAAAVLGAAGTQAWAADGSAEAGKKKTQMCAGCHGLEGFRTAYPVVYSLEGFRTAYPVVYSVPKLGGQNANYIVAALKAYKSGDRNHPSMRGIAGSLSDQDMADLAAYYSNLGQ